MTTIQEYLNQDKNTEYIYIEGFWYHSMLDGGELDLSDFANVKKININGINLKPSLTKIINCKNLTNLEELHLWYTGITDLDFLKELPNPEKLKVLEIPKNDFLKHDPSNFKRFVNLSSFSIDDFKKVFNSPEVEIRAETTEQELARLRIENERLTNQNKFLLEQLELTAQIEQPPK